MKREPFFNENKSYMVLNEWQTFDRNLIAGITTRHNETGAPLFQSFNMALHVGDEREQVIANRKSLCEQLNVELVDWVCAEQIHGSTIGKVGNNDKGRGATSLKNALPETDGLYTKDRNLLLTMFFADCVPLIFYAPNEGIIGLAHAGWRGTVRGIAGNMVDTWAEAEGVGPDHIYAAIGPSIGKCCYEVDRRVIDKVDRILELDDIKPYDQVNEDHYKLDLRALNHSLLLKAGIPDGQITQTSYCTSCHNDIFFSHRKENGRTGRMMSFISL